MFIFCYQVASKQCEHQTKTSVFLTTRHLIPNFYFKINKTHVKERPYYNTVNYVLYREQNTKNYKMKNKQVQH